MAHSLLDRITAELKNYRVCHVATVEGDRPLNSTVEYVADGTSLFFVSIPGTRKLSNIAANPSVAITMSSDGGSPDQIRGIQYFGTARRIEDAERCEQVRTKFMDKFLLEPSAHWSRTRSVYVEVSPQRIDLIDYGQEFGHKEIWTPDADRPEVP